GIHPKFFKNEYTKAVDGLATEDCSFAACHECGLCNDKTGVKPVVHERTAEIAAPENVPAPGDEAAAPARYRFQYRKVGPGIYLSALDLQTLLVRAVVRAGFAVEHDT